MIPWNGIAELQGTGFAEWGDAGATSWLQTTAPVTGGDEFMIRFAIWDTGDMALDSTALMLSKDAQSLNAEQLASKANVYFNALFLRPEASNVQVTHAFSSPEQGSFKLIVTGSATIDVRGTITSWTRRLPSSMTALIICSSSASRIPCSPPRSVC